VEDSAKALELDPGLVKAYLRKGCALLDDGRDARQ
jgi:hypothetical protein